jgi:hypothetical protein
MAIDFIPTTISTLIHTAVASHQTRFAAQHGIFIDSMERLIEVLGANGHKLTQNDGVRVLVDNTAWVTRHGVIDPVSGSNL